MPHPLANQLKHQPFPKLASALRKRAETIADSWMEVVREVMPQMRRLSLEELRNTIPQILEGIAAALASDNRDDLAELIKRSPEHGFSRFGSEHNLLDMFEEERLLRGVIVVEIEDELEHQMGVAACAALHATIDFMIQQSILSMVEKQKEQLRAAAESEVKFMAFLAHDLNNNLFIIHTALDHIIHQLQNRPECQVGLESVTTAQQAIRKTVHGMKRLLQHERLRKSGEKPTFKRLNLLDAVNGIARQFRDEAQRKGLHIEVKSHEPPQDATVETDEELIALVLQNLVGNAVKYADHGTVEIVINHVRPAAQQATAGASAQASTSCASPCWTIAVNDQGPGIEPRQRQRIFEAFKRGESFGHEGIGLGLAIASQAAKLLAAQLNVESKPGEGSTFSLSLPANE